MKRIYLALLLLVPLSLLSLYLALVANNPYFSHLLESKGKPKTIPIALLFFIEKELQQPEVWKAFLENSEANNLFRVYLYTDQEVDDPFWKKRKINRQVPYNDSSHMVVWHALLQEALKQRNIKQFVCLTEDCVPIKTPREVYEALSNQSQQTVMAINQAEYHKNHFGVAFGFMPEELWQNEEWVVYNRDHAQIVAQDNAWVMHSYLYPYGHFYFPSTFLAMKGKLNQINNHSFTLFLRRDQEPKAGLHLFQEADELVLQLLKQAKADALFLAPVSSSFPKEELLALFSPPPIHLTAEQSVQIGKHIWQRECRGTIEGLTSWNKGEEFPSLGIGHFIWYPANCQAPFQESFPSFLAFLEARGRELPLWLTSNSPCPWSSREEFNDNLQSPAMQELRTLLLETIPEQTDFICQRLEGALSRMQFGLSAEEQRHLLTQYTRLTKSARSIEALIDYIHFKGEGITALEQYRGQGWGLKQVLLQMHGTSEKMALEEFVNVAKKILENRVKASPPERGEKRWLKGWHQRLESYLKS